MSETVIDLILADEDAERARLEALFRVRQEDMVDFYLVLLADAGTRVLSRHRPGSFEERRRALRAFLRETRKKTASKEGSPRNLRRSVH